MIGIILAWLMLAVSVLYVLEPPWRMRTNRPGKWAPLYAEFLLPFVFVLIAASNHDARLVRVLTAVLMCIGAVLRLVARRRFGIPAWPAG